VLRPEILAGVQVRGLLGRGQVFWWNYRMGGFRFGTGLETRGLARSSGHGPNRAQARAGLPL